MSKLYCTATGLSSLINVNVSISHSSATATATIECINKGSVEIGDSITIDIGYTTNHAVIFEGYVKSIERRIPENTFTITANDKLIRAVDYFVVSSDPENPTSYSHISAEDLVLNVLELAGIDSGDFECSPSYFTFAINTEAEVNLTSSFDYARMISNVIAWELWADETGTIQFRNRKPYVMKTGTPDESQPGFVADTSIGTITDASIINMGYSKSDRDLRNRVVVYGVTGIYAEQHASSPYLPADFYKSTCIATPIIDTVSEAQKTALYNLTLLNKLTERTSMNVVGDPLYIARKVITLNGTHYSDVNDDWYIYSSEHNWSKSGYTVGLDLRR